MSYLSLRLLYFSLASPCCCVNCAAFRKCAQQICAASLLPPTLSQGKYLTDPNHKHSHAPTTLLYDGKRECVSVYTCMSAHTLATYVNSIRQ